MRWVECSHSWLITEMEIQQNQFHVRYMPEISEQEAGSNRLQNKVKFRSNSNNLVHDYSKL